MAHLTTPNFTVHGSNETLVVRRKIGPALMAGAALGLGLFLLLAIPFTNIFIYHYQIRMNLFRVCAITFSFSAFFVPLLPTLIQRSRKKVVIFDRSQNQVLIDGESFCPLTDLSAVIVNRGPTRRRAVLFGLYGLYLETGNGNTTIIDEAGGVGPGLIELEEVGQAIVDFAGIESQMI